MNKKAQFDLIEIVITLITIAFLILIVILVNDKVTDVYKDKITDTDSTAYKAIDKANTTFQSGLDKLFVGIFIILLIGMVILAFYIQASVLFLAIFILLTIISTWFAAVISNVYMTTEATGIFATALTYLPMQTFIMENLPLFVAGFGMVLLVITYAKNIAFGRVGIEP